MGICIQNAGLLTSVQDRGRFGHQKDGLSPAGAMDLYSMRLANLLVDNPLDEAVLETTYIGPELHFTEANYFSVTGAPMDLHLNGSPVPMGAALYAAAGSILTCGAVKAGCRSYIAFAGGLDVPVMDGSKSTLLRNTIGGWNGRKLKVGDEIGFVHPLKHLENAAVRYLPQNIENKAITLRVIEGPQEDRFTQEGLDTFYGSEYEVTQECDRMGSRLTGARIEHQTDGNIISDGIALGAIQVPTSGLPIIMLSERQSMGGYTKIANVISIDLPRIAQAVPGTKVRFQKVRVEAAEELWKKELEQYETIRRHFHKEHQKKFYFQEKGHSTLFGHRGMEV